MKVWLVWSEGGEYEQHYRELEGIFATEELAQDFAKQLGTDQVEEWDVLASPPVRVTRYLWTDSVMVNGDLSPDRPNQRNLGQSRDEWQSWEHQEPPLHGEIRFWNGEHSGRPELYVEVTGTDKAAVEAEHARLVAEARARLQQPA